MLSCQVRPDFQSPRLRERQNLQELFFHMPSIAQDDAAGTYRLQEGVAIADERELRLWVRPEEWCAHESMSNSLALLQQQGVSQQDKLAAIPVDRLRIAAEQLSPPEVFPLLLCFAKEFHHEH